MPMCALPSRRPRTCSPNGFHQLAFLPQVLCGSPFLVLLPLMDGLHRLQHGRHVTSCSSISHSLGCRASWLRVVFHFPNPSSSSCFLCSSYSSRTTSSTSFAWEPVGLIKVVKDQLHSASMKVTVTNCRIQSVHHSQSQQVFPAATDGFHGHK